VVFAAAVFFACGGGGGGGGGQQTFNPDPATGRWFGRITVLQVTHHRANERPGPGMLQQVDATTKIVSEIDVSETGQRTELTVATQQHDQDVYLEAECANQHSSAFAEGSGRLEGSGAGAYPGLPPGFDAGALPPGFDLGMITGSSYYMLAGDGADGFRLQMSPGYALVNVTGTSSARQELKTCDDSTVLSNNDTWSGAVSGAVPWDQISGTLSRDKRSAVGTKRWVPPHDPETVYDLTWSLKRDKELVAKVGGPYSIQRGEQVTLDGSQSRGDIDEYEWKVTPRADCSDSELGLSVGKQVEKKAKTFTFVALCDLDVRLTVRGRAGEDSDHGRVDVTPRDWKTEWKGSTPQVVDFGETSTGGSNQCASESTSEVSSHFLHRTLDAPGYEVKQVQDQEGPFHEDFYAVSPEMHVGRREAINLQYVGEFGSVYVATGAPFNQLLEAQIREHEKAHSTLLKGWLDQHRGSRDPMRKVEKLLGKDEESLRKNADAALAKADEELCKATRHELVFGLIPSTFEGVDGTVRNASGGTTYVPNLRRLANDRLTCE